MTEKKYNLTGLTEAQLRAIMMGCEALARIGMGQFGYAILDNTHHLPNYMEMHAAARQTLDGLINAMGGGRYSDRGGPSITNPEVPNQHRAAWDVVQVARHQLFKDGKFLGHVAEGTPLRCGDDPLPGIAHDDEEGLRATMREFQTAIEQSEDPKDTLLWMREVIETALEEK